MRFTFYLYFTRERSARTVAARLVAREFDVTLQAPDAEIAEWSVLAKKDLNPDVVGPKFGLTEWRLRMLAARHGGEYDGHSPDLEAGTGQRADRNWN